MRLEKVGIMYKEIQNQFNLARSLKHHKAYNPPWQVQISITNKCNLKCVMCDRWKWMLEDEKTAEVLNTQRLFKLFSELDSMGVKNVFLTGGEPLLRLDFVDIIKHLSNLNMTIDVVTNGTLMDTKKAKSLAAANATVFFSIDGTSQTHDRIRGLKGTFNRAIKGIRNMIKARSDITSRAQIKIGFTVQKDNVKDIVPCFELANELGVDTIIYSLVHGQKNVAPNKKNLEDIQKSFQKLRKLQGSSRTHIKLIDQLTEFIEERIPLNDVKAGFPVLCTSRSYPVPCFAVYKECVIDGFGRVFPCCFCYFDIFPYHEYEELREKFTLGNILEKNFHKVWYGDKYNKFRAYMDPVNVDENAYCCGQCADYFKFKKYYRRFRLLEKTGLLR